MDGKKKLIGSILVVLTLSLVNLTESHGLDAPPPPPGLKEFDSGYRWVYWVQSSFHAGPESLKFETEEVNSLISQHANFPLKILSYRIWNHTIILVGPLGGSPAMDTCERMALQQLSLRVLTKGEEAIPGLRTYAEKSNYVPYDDSDGYDIVWLNAKSLDSYPAKFTCTIYQP